MARSDIPRFIDARLVLRTALAAAAVQLLVLGVARVCPPFSGLGLLFGRMMVSATAGYIYGLIFGGGYGPSAAGGAISGGLCAVPALALGVVIGETGNEMVATGAGISVLTGAVGGAFGQMGAILRKLGL